jgi:hypothetical protein
MVYGWDVGGMELDGPSPSRARDFASGRTTTRHHANTSVPLSAGRENVASQRAQ